MTLLGENIGVSIYGLGLANDFLDISPIWWTLKTICKVKEARYRSAHDHKLECFSGGRRVSINLGSYMKYFPEFEHYL